MNTDPQSSSNESESNIQSGITRRSFIKRTTATAVVAALALNSFRNEARAVEGGSATVDSTISFDTTKEFEGTFESKEQADAAIEAAKKDGSIINYKPGDPIPAPGKDVTPPTKLEGPTGSVSETTWTLPPKWHVKLPKGHYKFKVKKPA